MGIPWTQTRKKMCPKNKAQKENLSFQLEVPQSVSQ